MPDDTADRATYPRFELMVTVLRDSSIEAIRHVHRWLVRDQVRLRLPLFMTVNSSGCRSRETVIDVL
jgi:hypothetical protein